MNQLFLADLKGLTNKQVQSHIVSDYEVSSSFVKEYSILIAYESVGSWGCDSSSYFLLKHKKSGKLFEVQGSHCSCYGFEGQFEPQETPLEYLKSDKFWFPTGGYDDNSDSNVEKVREYISKMRKTNVKANIKLGE